MMKIKDKYIQKYLYDIVRDQVADDYRERGYDVLKETPLGRFIADLVAQKGDETTVIEIKVGKMTPELRQNIASLADYVKSLGNYNFRLVLANPFQNKKLEIDEIENILAAYFTKHIPEELATLSPHAELKSISDVSVDEIDVKDNGIHVTGDGLFQIAIPSEPKNEHYYTACVPFDFKILLNYHERGKLQLDIVDQLNIDTSFFDD
jgi:Holliday junction resolvase